jgi:two-component system, chemotaxis family, chemotaxis protein CheY
MSSAAFEHLRVMIVEDNHHMRSLLRTLLNSVGIREIVEANNGASALTAMREKKCDLVLTDLAMKPMDGLEFSRTVRMGENSPNPFVPIIMITGHTEKHRVEAARDAGITEFLAKPISATALYERILNLVANPRPFIRTKTYFGPDRRRNAGSNYLGPERRKGGKADVIRQQPLLDKVLG